MERIANVIEPFGILLKSVIYDDGNTYWGIANMTFDEVAKESNVFEPM